jgi:hypothetical protein
VATKQRVDIDVVVKNQQRIDKLEASLGRTAKGASSLGNAARVAAGAIAAIGVGKGISSLIRVGQEVENLGLRFKFLFGSAEEGARAFDTLNEFAGRVPFSLEQISAASGNLAVVAKDATELNDILEITANVATVSGLDFRTAGEQIQRAFSGGIASADIFRERGVRSLLGFKEGATVTAEETRAAFAKVFGKGGEFGNAANEFADTFTGTLSMLGDKLRRFQEDASESFFEELKVQLGDLNEFFDENAVTIEEFAETVGAALAVAVAKAAQALKLLKDNADLVAAAFGFLVGMKIGAMFLSLAASIRTATIAMRAFNLAAMVNPFILLATGVAAAIVAFKKFGGEIENNTDGLDDYIGNVDLATGKTIELEEATDVLTQKQTDALRLLQNINAQYKSYRVILPEVTNREKGIAKAIEANIINFDNLKSANRSFVDSILQLGETETDKIIRIEAERQQRLEELYKKDAITKKEFELLKTKIIKDADRQRQNLEKQAETKRQQQFNTALENIRSGKLEELDIENMTTKQKVEVAKAGFSTILEQGATFNKEMFEINKKVQIATALVNTYAGVTNALKTYPPPFSFIMAGAQLAFGMAQVNAIKNQQFPGRERGGPVQKGKGYLVGESGVEYFQPNQNGTIIPNDQMMGQNNVTVNFNINATDAGSFDELLIERRDTIVGVINEALNENGQRSLV